MFNDEIKFRLYSDDKKEFYQNLKEVGLTSSQFLRVVIILFNESPDPKILSLRKYIKDVLEIQKDNIETELQFMHCKDCIQNYSDYNTDKKYPF